ncbi:MAG: hypothetical protein PHZ19_02815 [Candidatus Thermoplasmatota archaeon]|nr:hypothetical protein [Candidatus Thermoplasmatota archaeon]
MTDPEIQFRHKTNTQDDDIKYILREIELLRDEYKSTCDLFRSDIRALRGLIERELYGEHGENGIKTQVSKNTEFRETFTKYKVAVIGAFTTGLLSLVTMIINSLLGK